MKNLTTLLIAAALAVAACSLPAVDQRNLSISRDATQKIGNGDTVFLGNYTIYSAGTKENPTALLFDFKRDDYDIAIRLWGEPLGEKEVEYTIHRLHEQYKDPEWRFLRFEPRALTVINRKGEKVGYIYTSLDSVPMKRYQDGTVKVYRPMPLPHDGNGNDREVRDPA